MKKSCAKPKLLIAESRDFCPEAIELLQRAFEVRADDLNRLGLLQSLAEIDVLWVRLRNRVDAEVMDSGRHLKTIVTNTTGLDHIDLVEAERRGIRVLSLKGETDFLQEIRSTAELALALILALVRRIPSFVEHTRNGLWNRDLFKGNELYGKTAGIFGYGRLGRIVAKYLLALDIRVLATDPALLSEGAAGEVKLVDEEYLLQNADLVTLHVNLSRATTGFFGRRHFTSMKPRAWFVNTSRGELVDEVALLDVLESGHLAGAALDVVSNEQADDFRKHPLVRYARTHDNLLLTPHIGGNTIESCHKTELFLAKRLLSLSIRSWR